MFGKHSAGIYEKAFDPQISWQERLDRAARLGFDYVEISIDETDERLARLDWSREQKKELLDAVWNSGVSLRSMCLSGHRRFPFGSRDPATREKAHEIMEKAIDFASELGIRIIQLAGYDVYYEDSTEDSVRCFAEGMHWAAERAADAQVMLAMEIMDTPFMNSITKHLPYEKQINSPWYCVYPDLGNLSAWSENDPKAELDKGIGSILAIHLKDTLPPTESFAGQFKCVPFGAGCVDFSARFAQLERLGYAGPYMIEMWHQDGTDDVTEIAKAAKWLQEQYEKGILKCWNN
ncbi:MAG: L-ribulose-5-phosphate 3-epimerase [Ruminococcaceae bacterium]|nr:L-ribulose-5-phosphate 3-epimerase [Oscillospiraceae bacterium]